jgi:hypothetical protein
MAAYRESFSELCAEDEWDFAPVPQMYQLGPVDVGQEDKQILKLKC